MENRELKAFIDDFMRHHMKIFECFRPRLSGDLSKRGLGVPHAMVLNILSRRAEAPIIADLSRELGISAPMMTHIIDRMEQEGIVKRVRGIENRRIVKVQLTVKGKGVVRRWQEQFKERLTSFIKDMNGNDQKAFVRSLTTLMEILSRQQRIY